MRQDCRLRVLRVRLHIGDSSPAVQAGEEVPEHRERDLLSGGLLRGRSGGEWDQRGQGAWDGEFQCEGSSKGSISERWVEAQAAAASGVVP